MVATTHQSSRQKEAPRPVGVNALFTAFIPQHGEANLVEGLGDADERKAAAGVVMLNGKVQEGKTTVIASGDVAISVKRASEKSPRHRRGENTAILFSGDTLTVRRRNGRGVVGRFRIED